MKAPISPAISPPADPSAAAGQGTDPRSLTLAIKEEALRLGFLAAGVASPEALTARQEELRRWLARGHAGGLTYMERFLQRQAQLLANFPELRSIIVLAAPYGRREPHPQNDTERNAEEPAGRVARYAQGRDYHRALRKRIRRLEAFIRDQPGESARTLHSVDKGPFQERALAEAAGLGFIGKNTLLIHPKAGSFLFLGLLLTNLELIPDAPLQRDCGSCTLCLEACPTHAFVSPYEMDAGRCIANLTIENRGAIPPDLRPLVGDWLFGCDICQEVCPYNRGPGTGPDPAPSPWPEFSPRAGVGPRLPLATLLDDLRTDAHAETRFAATPLLRAKRVGLLRNASVAAGNSGSTSTAILQPLTELAMSDPDHTVREHAAWALAQIPPHRAL